MDGFEIDWKYDFKTLFNEGFWYLDMEISYSFPPLYLSPHNPFLHTAFYLILFCVINFYPHHMFLNTLTIRSNLTIHNLLRWKFIKWSYMRYNHLFFINGSCAKQCNWFVTYLDMDLCCIYLSYEHLPHNPYLHLRLVAILLYWKTSYLRHTLQNIRTNCHKMTIYNQLYIEFKTVLIYNVFSSKLL